MFTKLLLSLSLFVFMVIAHAQDLGRFAELENKNIARDLDVMSFILKLGDEVEAKKGLPLSDKAWAADLAEASMELMKRAYADGPQEKTIIEKFRKVFNWDALWAKTKSMAKYVKSFSRHKGLAAAFILVSTAPSDLYLPAIFTALGKPELIPLAAIVPVTPLAMWGESTIQNFRSLRRIKAAIGGAQVLKDFLAARKEVLAEIGVKANQYIHPISVFGSEVESLIINKSGHLKKILSKIGFKEKGITLGNVKKYLKAQNLLEDEVIRSILTQDLPDETKAGQVIYHLRFQRSEEMAYNVVAEFHESFRMIKINQSQGALWDAYQTLMKVKNLDELRHALDLIPTHVDPKDLAQLWKEKLIPEWSKNLDDISVFEFRRLVNGFDPVYGNMIAPSAPQVFDQATKNHFLGYLEKVKTTQNACSEAFEAM